jgi:hypothetical protein
MYMSACPEDLEYVMEFAIEMAETFPAGSSSSDTYVDTVMIFYAYGLNIVYLPTDSFHILG